MQQRLVHILHGLFVCRGTFFVRLLSKRTTCSWLNFEFFQHREDESNQCWRVHACALFICRCGHSVLLTHFTKMVAGSDDRGSHGKATSPLRRLRLSCKGPVHSCRPIIRTSGSRKTGPNYRAAKVVWKKKEKKEDSSVFVEFGNKKGGTMYLCHCYTISIHAQVY